MMGWGPVGGVTGACRQSGSIAVERCVAVWGRGGGCGLAAYDGGTMIVCFVFVALAIVLVGVVGLVVLWWVYWPHACGWRRAEQAPIAINWPLGASAGILGVVGPLEVVHFKQRDH